jgi:methylenetetrahydrofolate dehydrogenase (NADP+) / methenyltetrahydrofolate cyclohydrolase
MNQIDGRAIAKTIREEIKKEVASMRSAPGLGVILVGDDAPSHLYVNLKEKAALEVGIKTDIKRLPATTSDNELIHIIEAWNADPAIHGILVQLPLPPGNDADRVIAAIAPQKDVDGFHPENISAIDRGEATIISPVHETVLRLVASTGIDPRGKAATILANSETFANPLIHLLQRAGFVTAMMHPDAIDAELIQKSHVIVTAVGRAGFLGRDIVTPGTVIIDVGVSRGLDGNVHGDADAKAFENLDGWITPVPGGVGPMTVALLLKNVVRAYGASRES